MKKRTKPSQNFCPFVTIVSFCLVFWCNIFADLWRFGVEVEENIKKDGA